MHTKQTIEEGVERFDGKFKIDDRNHDGITTIVRINYGWSKCSFRATEEEIKEFIISLSHEVAQAVLKDVEEGMPEIKKCQNGNIQEKIGFNKCHYLIDILLAKIKEEIK